MREVDIAIIGAGTAGMATYRAACERTDRLALIEGGHCGTACAGVDRMPSKLLIAAPSAPQRPNQLCRLSRKLANGALYLVTGSRPARSLARRARPATARYKPPGPGRLFRLPAGKLINP